MEMAHKSNLIMPAKCTLIEQEEATYLDGGALSVTTALFTALGIYGGYNVYTNLRDYISNNRQKVEESVTSGFNSFMNLFEKLAVVKLAFEVLTFIF